MSSSVKHLAASCSGCTGMLPTQTSDQIFTVMLCFLVCVSLLLSLRHRGPHSNGFFWHLVSHSTLFFYFFSKKGQEFLSGWQMDLSRPAAPRWKPNVGVVSDTPSCLFHSVQQRFRRKIHKGISLLRFHTLYVLLFHLKLSPPPVPPGTGVDSPNTAPTSVQSLILDHLLRSWPPASCGNIQYPFKSIKSNHSPTIVNGEHQRRVWKAFSPGGAKLRPEGDMQPVKLY